MTYNEKNDKYKSALKDLPFEARQVGKPATGARRGRGRPIESQSFYLRPVLRNPPDIERLGRAILEQAMLSGDQKTGEDQENLCQD